MSRKRHRGSFRHERGQAFIFVAILMPVLLGLSALGVDVGGWYTQSRKAQSAADAAAIAAAWWLRPEDTSVYDEAITAGQESFATNSASWNPGGATAEITPGYNSGISVNGHPVNPVETVQVVVHATAHTFFGGIFGWDGVNVTKTAVAARAEVDITPQIFAYGPCGGSGKQHDNGFFDQQSGLSVSGGIISNGQFTVTGSDNHAGAAVQYVGGAAPGSGKKKKAGAGNCGTDVAPGNGFPDPQVLPTADPNPWDWPMIFSPSEFNCTYSSPFTYKDSQGHITQDDDLIVGGSLSLQGVLSGSTLASGTYCVDGKTKILSDGISGNVTFLSDGKIEIYGKDASFTAYQDNVVFFACKDFRSGSCSWEGEMHLSGDNLHWDGIVYAPNGGVEIGEGSRDEDKLSDGMNCTNCLVEGWHIKVLAPNFSMQGTPAGDPLQPVGLVKLIK